MKTATAIFVAMLAFGYASASAQTYAGKWEASGPAAGKCAAYDAHISVAGNDVVIAIKSTYSYTLKGTVASDGSFKAETGANTASGKFAGEAVELTLKSSCGARSGTGSRAS